MISARWLAAGTACLAACSFGAGDDTVTIAAAPGAPDAAVPPDGADEAYEPWTLVVLPDTQQYAYAYPDIFEAQTSWIADNVDALNIRYVLHVGDITEWNTPTEWEVSRDSFAKLMGVVPFAIVPGNHDYYVDRARVSPLTDYFPVAEVQQMPGFGGLFEPDKLDNSFHTFEVNGESWLIVALEWGPRDEVLAWANHVLDEHPDRRVIILTHAYLYLDDSRYDWATNGSRQLWNPHSYPAERWPEVNDGEEIWQAVIKDRDNVDLVICGHAAQEGIGRRTSTTATGHPVHELLANFQDYAEGGQGYLRIMTFHRDHIEIRTYSPWVDHDCMAPENQFMLPR